MNVRAQKALTREARLVSITDRRSFSMPQGMQDAAVNFGKALREQEQEQEDQDDKAWYSTTALKMEMMIVTTATTVSILAKTYPKTKIRSR